MNEFELEKIEEIYKNSKTNRTSATENDNLLLESFVEPPYFGEKCQSMISLGKQSFDQKQYLLQYDDDGTLYLRAKGRWEYLRNTNTLDSVTKTFVNDSFRVVLQPLEKLTAQQTDRHKQIQIFLNNSRMFEGTVYEDTICK